tara:strand:+ start:261 stop:869 length:609 start_codon:yes stop_codon:yes gene_type:complete
MAKRPVNIRRKIIDAALSCALEVGWNNVSLQMIASTAGTSLGKVYANYRSKTAIVAAIMDETTSAVIDRSDSSTLAEPQHDRLLDTMMRIFDAMEVNKAAIASILREIILDPLEALSLAPRFLNGMNWTLEAAGISTNGLVGKFRVKGLAAIYLAALRVWIDDDTPDLAKTMAFLDQRLRQAIKVANILSFDNSGHHMSKNI